MEIKNIVIIIVFTLVYNGLQIKYLYNMKKESHYQWIWILSIMILPLGIILFLINNISFSFFYIFFVFYKWLQIYPTQDDRYYKYSFALLRTILFGIYQLITIGIIAILLQIGLSDVLQVFDYCFMSLLIPIGLDAVMSIIMESKKQEMILFQKSVHSKYYQYFIYFMMFCFVYIIVEAFLCQQDILLTYTPMFVIGGNLIMLFMLFSFLNNIYTIITNIDVEERYFHLQSQMDNLNQSQKELREMINRDILTGIYSREYVRENIQHMIQANEEFSVAYIDLDQLKLINDSYGHQKGDEYLCRFTVLMNEYLRKQDIFARVGGDEFLIIFPKYDDSEVFQVMDHALKMIEKEDIYFSYGISVYIKEKFYNFDELISDADVHMRENKRQKMR